MSVTTPPTVDTLPAAPDPGNRSTFNTLAYPWSAALPTFSTQLQALANNVALNATDAASSASGAAAQVTAATAQAINAAASASAAATTAGAAAWVNGGTYALNANAISQIDYQTYRKKTASSVTTIDPKNDTANWVMLGAVGGIGTVGSTVTSNTTLTASSAGYQFVQMSSLGKSLTLPDATTMQVGGPRFVIDNTKGGYPCGIRDNTGTLVMAVAAGGEAFVMLKDNSTAAGSWSVTGTNLEPGLITLDSTFSSTYASTVLAPFVALDNNTSIHFAALSSGFAAFVVDNTGKVLSTPVTVSSTASHTPRTAFKISATTAIVFYGNAAIASAVVITLSGSSPSYSLAIGTPQNLPRTFSGEDFTGAPRVAQLTSTLYLCGYNVNSGSTYCTALSVSGATITMGAEATITATAAPNDFTTTTYPLTATTALVLYKTGAAAPYTNNAVVISVSGTTCTVNTPVALTNCASSATSVPSSVLVSATKCLVADDNNVSGTVMVIPVTISGTTVTAGTNLSVETGVGTTAVPYTANYATRYNPHLWTLTTGATNTVGLWYFDTNSISRVVVLSETSGTITAGTILYRSISTAGDSTGLGCVLPQSPVDFLSIKSNAASGGAYIGRRITSHKIAGTNITPGAVMTINPDDLPPQSSTNALTATRLSSGDYVIGVPATGGNLTGNASVPVFRSNGDYVIFRGAIRAPILAVGSWPVQSVNNRIVLLGGTSQEGTTVGATTYQLRLLNVEIAA